MGIEELLFLCPTIVQVLAVKSVCALSCRRKRWRSWPSMRASPAMLLQSALEAARWALPTLTSMA